MHYTRVVVGQDRRRAGETDSRRIDLEGFAVLEGLPAEIRRGLLEHLQRHRALVASGVSSLGWKIAFNAPAAQRSLGLPHPLTAGLTEASRIPAGSHFALAGRKRVALEAEIAVELRAPIRPGQSREEVALAIARWAPAIEIVELNRGSDEIETILAEGVFHRAVAIGPWSAPADQAELRGIPVRISIDGESICEVDAGEATGDVCAILAHLAGVLGALGESLAPPAIVILGSMNPLTFARPDSTFCVEVGGLGVVEVQLGA